MGLRSSRMWAIARDLRYAIPRAMEHLPFAPDAHWVARKAQQLGQQDIMATAGYFGGAHDDIAQIMAANIALLNAAQATPTFTYLSVKAPQLGFDCGYVDTLARHAQACGKAILFDAHAPSQADATLTLVDQVHRATGNAGVVLPARWHRSKADADHFRDAPLRIRIVKGEWPDDGGDRVDPHTAYLALTQQLVGRQAPVAIATHNPLLARQALMLLRDAGTPCELEQLRGLPRRRTTIIARDMEVPVRLYLPFGPGWWPYAADKALARPYLLRWMVQDRFGAACAA